MSRILEDRAIESETQQDRPELFDLLLSRLKAFIQEQEAKLAKQQIEQPEIPEDVPWFEV